MREQTEASVMGLRSRTCACGRPKSPGHSFCRACYGALPQDARQALWSSLGHGYEEAYQVALGDLRGKGRVQEQAP